LKLSPNGDGSWTERVIHSFNGKKGDGSQPYAGLIFDSAGNLYGTTIFGGVYGGGTAFQLSPKGNGDWTERVIHSFDNSNGYDWPYGDLIFDTAGNLYGTTNQGGTYGNGKVFELVSKGNGRWTESVLHSFNQKNGDGYHPYSGLIFDPAGRLYGTTNVGGTHGNGTVFRLTPSNDGKWKETVIHSFVKDGQPIYGRLISDTIGSLYGTTTVGGAYGWGTVFRLNRNSKGGWMETVLHSFRDRPGADATGRLIFDATGILYGSTAGDATNTFGSVFEITP